MVYGRDVALLVSAWIEIVANKQTNGSIEQVALLVSAWIEILSVITTLMLLPPSHSS